MIEFDAHCIDTERGASILKQLSAEKPDLSGLLVPPPCDTTLISHGHELHLERASKSIKM